MYLHNAITAIQTYTNNLNFNDGLHQAGNNVVALHDEGLWNASKFQGRNVSSSTPLNGQVYAWDSVLLVWKPTSVSGGSGITQTQLDDTASAIRTAIIAASGLQAVTDVDRTTTHDLLLSGSTFGKGVGGYGNIAIGRFVLNTNTSGVWNTAVGDSALMNPTTGQRNTLIGHSSGRLITTGNYNVGVGVETLEPLTTGLRNTAVGFSAMGAITTGNRNIAVGWQAGNNLTTGSDNILITGNGATVTTGNGNVVIGSATGMTGSENNHIYLSSQNGGNRLVIDSFGLWQMGTYGTGTHTGTAAYSLSVDATGHVIETASGGGGGSTPGIDDVLAVGQSLSAYRQIDATTLYGLSVYLAHDAINGDSYYYFDANNATYGAIFGGQIVSNDSSSSVYSNKYGNYNRSHRSGVSTGVDVTNGNGVDIFYNSTDLYVTNGEAGVKAASLFIDPLNTSSFHAGYVLTDVAGDGYATWQPVSGGSTPGIDNVLGVGQALSTNRTINLNSHTLTLDNASSITSALLFKNTGSTGIYMPNTTDLKFEASGGGSMTVQGNGFIKTPYYGFPTGSFHMNTGTFNGVAAYWNTSGVLIEKAAGATNIISKTFSNTGEEVYPFQGTVKVDATSGNTTLILGDPADGGFNTGGIMTFIKTDASANTVTVDAWTNWSATVNGVHTKTLTAQWQYIIVQSDGTNWYVVGGN
jgi:hypothetical protein